MRNETITFECPQDLLADIEAYIEESMEIENRSQAIRYAIRVITETGRLDLSTEFLEEIDKIVEASSVFESREHYIRVCHREYKDNQSGLRSL